MSQATATASNSNLTAVTAVELSLRSVNSELNCKNNETLTNVTPKYKKYIVLFACIMIQLWIRWIMVFGNYLPYFASVITSKNISPSNRTTSDEYISKKYADYTDQIVWTYSITTVLLSLTMSIGGQIEYKFGPKAVIFTGSILIISGLCLTYLVLEHFPNPYYLYGSYSLMGAGHGIIYTTPYLVAMRWFEHENKKGIVSGLVLSGLSISAILLNSLSTFFVNPNNIPIDPDIGFVKEPTVLNNVSTSFLKFASLCFFFLLFGIIFIQNPYEYTHATIGEKQKEKQTIFSEYGISVSHRKTTARYVYQSEDKLNLLQTQDNKMTSVSIKAIICSSVFWNLFFTLFFLPWTYVYSQWKELNNKYLGIENDEMLALMVSSSAIFQFVAFLFWGFMFDKLASQNRNAYKILMGVISCCLVIFIGTWTQLKLIENDTLLLVCAWIWVAVFYILLSGPASLVPTQVAHLYGTEKGGIVYGLLYCARIGSTLFSMTVITQARKAFGWYYMNVFWLVTQCILFLLVITSKSKIKNCS